MAKYSYLYGSSFFIMILVADSGSTKTDWVLIDNQSSEKYRSIGVNPFLHTLETASEIFRDVQLFFNYEINQVFFYGAGCSSLEKKELIERALSSVFTNANIFVYHDLLGAARSVCHNTEGLVAILGTGTNTCYYSGSEIVENVRSLGFILGDEGSGCFMGKKLLTDVLNEDIPDFEKDLFEKAFPDYTPAFLLDKIYKQELPNRFMASFTKWIKENKKGSDYLELIVINSFRKFFEQHIVKYSNHKKIPLNVIGSVGYFFSSELERVTQEFGVSLGNVVKSPIQGLEAFHQSK